MRRNLALAAACAASLIVVQSASAQFTLTASTAFGGGDGWRSPLEVLTGDTAGTAGGTGYNYLGAGNLERGLAFNPVTGNLVLVSRSTAGNGIRVLSGSTGLDIGFMNQGTAIIAGGTFTTNMTAIGADGAVYVANLQAVQASPTRIYRWENESAAAPTVFFSASSNLPRVGDSFDVTGSGASTLAVLSGGGSFGYSVIDSTGAVNTVTNFNGAAINTGAFRLGITFAGTANDVWGKQTSSPLAISNYNSGGNATLSATDLSANGGAAGETALDYAMIGGKPYLATIDANNSSVRIYDVTDPALPVKVAEGRSIPTGTILSGNGNGTASIKWGTINEATGLATIYAMSTNQGIQALTFSFPTAPSFIKGDFNFDGEVLDSDISLFVSALTGDFASLLAQFPTRTEADFTFIGDFNGDGEVLDSDITGFVAALLGGGGRVAAIPEPAALGLIAPMGLLLARRRRA